MERSNRLQLFTRKKRIQQPSTITRGFGRPQIVRQKQDQLHYFLRGQCLQRLHVPHHSGPVVVLRVHRGGYPQIDDERRDHLSQHLRVAAACEENVRARELYKNICGMG